MNANGKVIATDLDGTLFFPKHRFRMLSKRNKEFLRRFIDEGGRLLLVSGRNHEFSKGVVKRIKRNVDVAGCNGAFIIVDNKLIKKEHMPNQRTTEVIEDIKKRFAPVSIFLMCEDYNFIIPKKEFGLFNRFGFTCYQISQGIYREKTIKSDEFLHEQLKNGKIFKVMLFFGITKKEKLRCREANRQMRELYPDYEFSWCGQCIEMTNSGCAKSDAIKQYLDYLKIKHDNVMVVGDSGNDISMFRNFHNSFCMSHASSEISKYANHTIKSVSELEKYL